jgi:hypothetical protein
MSELDRAEKERLRDQAAREAEALLYGTNRSEPTYNGDMAAAQAHATLAAYYQARIEWEHGFGG